MKIKFLILFVLISSILFTSTAFADVVPPKKQMSFGIESGDVLCKEGYVKVIREKTNNPACVKASDVDDLVKRGWAKPVDSKLIEDAGLFDKKIVGQVTKLEVYRDPQPKYTTLEIASYHYIFEICAKENPIYAPEIVVKSDSATKVVKLADKIDANACQVSAAKISANNPESIVGTLTNKGGITNKLTMLETTIADLQKELTAAKSELGKVNKDTMTPDERVQKVSELTNSIVEKRKMINDAKEDLNQLLFALHVPTKIKLSELVKGVTHSGEPIEGLAIKKLATSEQKVEKGVFNVAFEVCTIDPVSSPVVTITSDSETKKVVFTEKITANTCQVSGAKIMATNADSIEISLGDTSERSEKILNYETELKALLDEIAKEKKELQQLLAKKGNESEIIQKAIKIENLRDQILKAKAALYNELYKSLE